MVPNVAKRVSSFKGCFAYHLHDKAEECEELLSTSERVEWTETRNLATNDPELASRVMAATAMDKDRLKRQAGIKNTGRKSSGNVVYSYSIAWHPDEEGKIDKDEMLKAADQSIRAIGAEDQQAVIVCHNDEPQPHVHIIVNLVSQENGKTLTIHKDYKPLEKWAYEYRKERGEEQLYCPARDRKMKAIEAKKRGEKVEFVRGDKSTPRSMEKDFTKAKAANQNEAKTVREQEKAKDAALSLHGKSLHHRHDREWVDLDEYYAFKVADIKAQAVKATDRVDAQVEEQFRPEWRDLRRRQYSEKQKFEKRETRLSGKVENALAAIVHRREIDPDSSRGFMGQAFNFLTSKKARSAALDKLHGIEQRNLSKQQREEVGAAINAIKSDRSALLSQAKNTFNADRASVIQRQAEEKKELQAKWKRRNDERKRALDTVVRKAKSKKAAPERKMRDEFKQAVNGGKRRRSKGRTRRRTRD